MSIVVERSAEGASSLDLPTLKTIDNKILASGCSLQPLRSPSWGWSITHLGEGTYEILGQYKADGHYGVKKVREKKKRATVKKEMTSRSVEESLKRTRKVIRHKCTLMKADKLVTLTTRASIQETEVFKNITTRFLKSCRREFTDFRYLAVFERHMSEKTSPEKYGSLHLHMAMQGFISYGKLRHLWRVAVQSVLKDGDYEGANIDAQGPRRRGMRQGRFNRHQIAKYMSKYLTKDMDDEGWEANKRRYWASRNIRKPEKKRFYSPPAVNKQILVGLFRQLLGVNIKRVFCPDVKPGEHPIIWLSTG